VPLGNPLRLDCSTCGAMKGERCVELETGDLMHTFHQSRQIAAIPRRLDHVREVLASKPTLEEQRRTSVHPG
jgi:hypothetical protein